MINGELLGVSTLHFNTEFTVCRTDKYVYTELYREIIRNQEEQEANQQFNGRQ